MPPNDLWGAYCLFVCLMLNDASTLVDHKRFGRHIVIAQAVCPSLFCVWCISSIFFEVGIPNLVCGCILGCQSVTYYIRVTMTLTSDLVLETTCLEHISYII